MCQTLNFAELLILDDKKLLLLLETLQLGLSILLRV